MSLKNGVLEASWLDFGGSKARFWSFQGWISTICWDFWGRFLPSKSSKTCLLKSTMPKMPKRLKRLRGQPSSRRKRPECDHEGLFYHHGQGKKGWAAVVPPGGLQLNPPPTVGGAGRAGLLHLASRHISWLHSLISSLLPISPPS